MSDLPVIGSPTGSRQAVLAFAQHVSAKRFSEVTAFVDELFDLGVACAYDAFMIAAQSAVETGVEPIGGGWLNRWWVERLNPGALGITGDSVQNEASQAWTNGRDAARAMLVHHAAYLGQLPDRLAPFVPLDERYQRAREFAAGNARGFVRTWRDYGNGYWATDPNYFNAIMARAAEIRGFEQSHSPVEIIVETGFLVAIQGATARRRPSRAGDEVRQLSAGEHRATNGFTDAGEAVAGSARWYRLTDDGSWVHSSGGTYTAAA